MPWPPSSWFCLYWPSPLGCASSPIDCGFPTRRSSSLGASSSRSSLNCRRSRCRRKYCSWFFIPPLLYAGAIAYPLQRARRWAAREAEPRENEPEDVAHDHDHFIIAPSHDAAAIDDCRAIEYRRVRSAMIHAEEEAIIDLRDRGVIADDVMRNIQRDLDLESLLLETSEPVVETAYEATVAIDAAAR